MKILIAPLNWGLGHASRCLPLITRYLKQGDEVVIAADGNALKLLRLHFPKLRYINLPALDLHYSKGNSQVGAMFKSLPKIIKWSIADHNTLQQILAIEHFDLVISDNRFGFYSKDTRCVYITHQLMIKMPKSLKPLEPLAHRLHLRVINHYDECWIPDFEGDKNLSGDLSHKYTLPKNAKFIGPLSRFMNIKPTIQQPKGPTFDLAVLSGIEPQRTLFEEQILNEYEQNGKRLLLVQGKITAPWCEIKHGNITIVPYLSDDKWAEKMLLAEHIIARSGYSTIMDMYALNVLDKAIFHATPGQTEQEYLCSRQERECPHSRPKQEDI